MLCARMAGCHVCVPNAFSCLHLPCQTTIYMHSFVVRSVANFLVVVHSVRSFSFQVLNKQNENVLDKL